MKSIVMRFSLVSVRRPRIASPARKKRSARRSACVIDSIIGARCCAITLTENKTTATASARRMTLLLRGRRAALWRRHLVAHLGDTHDLDFERVTRLHCLGRARRTGKDHVAGFER